MSLLEKVMQLGFVQRLLAVNEKYPFLAPALFFIFGFLFDILTLDRIDNGWMIFQQAIFLLLLAFLNSVELVHQVKPFTIPPRLQKIWHYREEAIHFLFGCLLSAYTIFYIKSSSFLASFFFIVLILFVLIANEFPIFRRMGAIARFTLWSLCLSSFLSYVIPVYVGRIGVLVFMGSMIASFILVLCLFVILLRWITELKHLLRNLLYPAILMNAFFLIAYITAVIPPVPLSLQYIGVFHDIQKDKGEYILFHEKPWWKFWQTGDEDFVAVPGDKLNLFIRIFSPSNFSEKIWLKWSRWEERTGWTPWDRIPIDIVGGREEGFRGVARKSNFAPGDWRVQVETDDQREIGRHNFTVTEDVSGKKRSREFNQLRM